jgi:hypothetical protein
MSMAKCRKFLDRTRWTCPDEFVSVLLGSPAIRVETNVRRGRTITGLDGVRRGRAAVRGAAQRGCFGVRISGIPGQTKAAHKAW